MAGTILTPAAIWRDFTIDKTPRAEIISNSKSGNLSFTELYIYGREVADGQVKIYAKLAKLKTAESAPAILLLGDFNRSCSALQADLAKKGYLVLAVDVAGFCSDEQKSTVYPESLSYANYLNVKDNLYKIHGDFSESCWYEWTAATRYALAYLKSLEEVTKVGGLGIGEAATVMWQVAGTDDKLNCACFALNAGWNGYREIYKFGGTVEPHFSNDMYKFIAGAEPQSYATHINCPILMLSATNSDVYDVDRAYDTVSRIPEGLYRAVHYSVGYRDSISYAGYQDALIFFENALKKKGKITLAKEIDIKCDIEGGAIKIEVMPDKKELESLSVYVSEQMAKPALRAYTQLGEGKEVKKGTYVFEYSPYPQSGMITAFAEAKYSSGFTVCSAVICKKFTVKEVTAGYKSNIIYSSRLDFSESIFAVDCGNCNDCEQIAINDNGSVKVKKGAMGIEGACRGCGLTTFKINADNSRPNPDAILMFDAHAKNDVNLTVKLVCDYFGAKTEYLATVKVYGGHIWHNFKLTKNKFKTAEGMPLKSYDLINAISFLSDDGEFLLNNALWV